MSDHVARTSVSDAGRPSSPVTKLSDAAMRLGFLVCLVTEALAGGAAETMRPPGEGAEFDGRTAYLVSGKKLDLEAQAITVSAWVKMKSVDAPQVFLNCGRADSHFTFYLFKEHVRMLVRHSPQAYAYATAPPPPPDTWVHFAGTYDGQTITLYVNGQPAGTARAEGRMTTDNSDLYIGALNPGERFLNGRLEEVNIWRRVLDAGEVAKLVAGERTVALEKDLVGRWVAADLESKIWKSRASEELAADVVARQPQQQDTIELINEKDDGYRGIWYANQPSNDEYVYKYSGGLGTYCAKHIPHAWYVPAADKTFFTYGGATKDNNRQLIHMVSYYDHKTHTVPRPTILLDKRTSDAHDNPVINVDEEGSIWIFSSSHGTSRPSFISRSTKPHSIDEFEKVWTGNYSYPQPWYLAGKGFLLVHTHYTGGRSNCFMTSADGVNWSQRQFLSRIAHGHYQISRPYGDTKVGIAFNYHPQGKGLNWRTNLYYMETSDFGTTWTNVQGEKLELMLTDVQNPALVHEYESKGLIVYMKDITFDAQGRPVILYLTSKGYESGPENMPRTWTTARWTGQAWEIHGGDIISDNNYDTGSLYIEAEDQWRIIGPTQPGPQRYNPGGEVAMWISQDQGRHWTMTRQMTQNSPRNHTYVRRPVNAHPDFYGFWADGHGRQPSESHLYFCNRDGDVFELPAVMDGDAVKPRRLP